MAGEVDMCDGCAGGTAAPNVVDLRNYRREI